MPTGFRLASVLLCLFFIAGCTTTGKLPQRSASAFPEQPAPLLAKTPEQCVLDKAVRGEIRRGGWGYCSTDAFVLASPGGRKGARRSTVAVESQLLQTRNEVEFSETPPPGKRWAVVDYGTVSRTLGVRDGRMYAVWRGRVSLVSEAESPELYRKLTALPRAKRAAPAVGAAVQSVSREYWFDISEAYASAGSGVAVDLRPEAYPAAFPPTGTSNPFKR